MAFLETSLDVRHGTSPVHVDKPAVRFVTCGSVDDGKSTLVGRLLHDSKILFDDQLDTLTSDSRVSGTSDAQLDFALLVDGLQAEREQGITIDVAYRRKSRSIPRRFRRMRLAS